MSNQREDEPPSALGETLVAMVHNLATNPNRRPPPPSNGPRAGTRPQLVERAVAGRLHATVTPCGLCIEGAEGWLFDFDENGVEVCRPCVCEELRRTAARVNAAAVPAEVTAPMFSAFRLAFTGDDDVAKTRNAAALAGVQRLVATLEGLGPNDRMPPGVVLAGPPGVGKTHLMAAAVRTLARDHAGPGLAARAKLATAQLARVHHAEDRDGIPAAALAVPAVRYVAWPEAMGELFAAMRSKRLQLVADQLGAVPVLALDEIAAGSPGDFERGQLNDLLVARHRKGLTTILGSNYHLRRDTGADDPEALVHRLGAHAFSRVAAMPALIMGGVDRRPLVARDRAGHLTIAPGRGAA